MEQLWELFGRATLDSQLVQKLFNLTHDGAQVFHNFVNGSLGYRLSRAEMADLYNLSSHPANVTRAPAFRDGVRSALAAAGIAEQAEGYSVQGDLREFRTFLGLLFPERVFQNAISSIVDAQPDDNEAAMQVNSLAGAHNFHLGGQVAKAVVRIFRSQVCRQGLMDVHDKWVPPDCFSAMTFSAIFREPKEGGVYRDDNVGPYSASGGPLISERGSADQFGR